MNNWLQKLNDNPIYWLLESNSWTNYRVLIDLLDKPEDSTEVIKAKKQLGNDLLVAGLINDSNQWFPVNATRHDDSKLAHYKLRLLSDLGFTKEDSRIQPIIEKAIEHNENGLFTIRQTLPVKGSIPGTEEWHALPCDSTILTYILLKLGFNNDLTAKNVEHLKEKWTTNQGWFCNLSFVNGQYKKLQTGCPMAGLMALEVFSLIPELKESTYSHNAYEPLKFHKEYGQILYYFGRSKKFWTLKYPLVWYNALYLADVLTRFDFTKDEPLLKDLIAWIEQSQTKEGRFIANSMFTNYKGWDFADKKLPSPWITFLCCRILKRHYE
ncbi:MAG TPA: hypothetical protein VHO50_10150 [Bacteroidales bacterium]|nr:hypothetical protein [Bacteroidales bacterium]